MNSMGVSPFVNRLYSDLSNGMVIFQLYDVIQKGTVDWNKVHQKFPNLRKVGLTNLKAWVEFGDELCSKSPRA